MKKIIPLLFSICFFFNLQAQNNGIRFTQSDFAEALQEAEKNNKFLFVDVYADWCGPCKMLSEQVFPDPQVGEYFNDRFICIKLNSDDPKNRSFIEKFQITALPTLLILNSKEEIVQKHQGMANTDQLIRIAKLALGEQQTPDELFDAYKKESSNIEKLQDILLDAPYFMPTLEGMQRDKWMKRITDLSKVYFKTRKPEEMCNRRDFNILTLFHESMEKNDVYLNFIIANYNQFFECIDTNTVVQYLITMHSNAVIDWARKGDKDYVQLLQRMIGDMLPIYAIQFADPHNYHDMYEKIAHANYAIYSERSFENYIRFMDEFLQIHTNPQPQDYAMVVETLFNATQGKLSRNAYEKSIEWLDKAFSEKTQVEMQTGIIMTMGDCYIGLDNVVKAKECYNQAYILVLKSQNQNFVTQMQQIIKQKLNAL